MQVYSLQYHLIHLVNASTSKMSKTIQLVKYPQIFKGFNSSEHLHDIHRAAVYDIGLYKFSLIPTDHSLST